MSNRCYIVAAAIAVTTLGARGGSSTGSSSTSASSGSKPALSTPTTASSAPTTSLPTGKALPDPCSLLTKAEVAPLFGTTALDQKPLGKRAGGSVVCLVTMSAGVQAKAVRITTRNDYGNDLSYVFPQATHGGVAGVGDMAVIDAPQTNVRRISVKLGNNALEIVVDFYTQPADEAFLTQLAKDAIARL